MLSASKEIKIVIDKMTEVVLIIGCSILALLVITIFAITYMVNGIIKRIKNVSGYLGNMRGGDLTTSIDKKVIDDKTEIGDIAESAIKLNFSLSEMIENTGMDRQKLETFILETYPASADRPWLQYPNYEVFRHSSNQKWFAVIMDLPKSKLGLQGEERVDAVNLKCGPILAGSLLMENGFFPAYHMRKDSWITVALDGSVADDKIKMLLDVSYQATAPKVRKKKG